MRIQPIALPPAATARSNASVVRRPVAPASTPSAPVDTVQLSTAARAASAGDRDGDPGDTAESLQRAARPGSLTP